MTIKKLFSLVELSSIDAFMFPSQSKIYLDFALCTSNTFYFPACSDEFKNSLLMQRLFEVQ